MDHLLSDLLEYNDRANREAARSIATTNPLSVKAVRLLAHIVMVEKLWLYRLERRDMSAFRFDEGISYEECTSLIDELQPDFAAMLERVTSESLAENIPYTTLAGEPRTETRRDILLHTLTHSAYHRGQIAMAVREAGGEPGETGFLR